MAKNSAKAVVEKVDLKSLFMGLQKTMAEELKTLRRNVTHPGSKGEACEQCWITLLKKYLPKRYSVEKAFVVDSKGNRSEEIDIVIFDQQYSPFLFHSNGALFVPAESVYAVLEAKQKIDKGMIEYAAKKAASVRQLHRTNGTIHWAQGKMARALYSIPAGIVALDCQWKDPMGKPFEKVIEAMAAKKDHQIDLGVAIEHGAFEVDYTDPKSLTFVKSGDDEALISFFLRLIARLQTLGTAPPIEIQEYLNVVGKSKTSHV